MDFNTPPLPRERTWGAGADVIAEENRRFMIRVYNWMSAGLGLTGLVAWIVSNDPALMSLIFGNKILLFGLIIAEVGMVFWLASSVMGMSVMTAMSVFMAYSALNGFTLAAIFAIYTPTTISTAFVVTAGTFGVMSFIGYTTKRDLTNLGGFLMMGLIGVVIASLANFWFQSPAIHWAVTYIGLFVFIGLTAYDTQKIKEMNIIGNEGTAEDTKEAIRGALSLYLDFINMFLFILQIMGGKRD